jgi:hypothetical protein
MSPADEKNLVKEAREAARNVCAFEKKKGIQFSLMRLVDMDFARPTPEDQSNLDALVEVYRGVWNANDCKRVRDGAQCLRAVAAARTKKGVPPEVRDALKGIAQTFKEPRKFKSPVRRMTERERAILAVYAERRNLNRAEREARARALGLLATESTTAWESLKRLALRYAALPFRAGG